MDQAAHFIEQVTRLTTTRDRNSAEAILADVMHQLLRPDEVNLVELVPVDGVVHCVCLAHLLQGTPQPDVPPAWFPPSASPTLADCPIRMESVDGQAPRTLRVSDGEAHWLIVPVVTETAQTYLLELRGHSPWTECAQKITEGCARMYQNFLNLLDYGERDTLTGLLNRKSFDETFFKTTQMPAFSHRDNYTPDQRSLSPGASWLGVIDIDFFKRVNDRFGHLIGDEVLLLVARLIQSTFRHDDRVYRFGGEEFVVLLRATDADAAHASVERLRRQVDAYRFPQVGQVTVSVGFSLIRQHDTPSGAFDRADRAVYHAKAHGRNQVCCFEQLEPQGTTGDSSDQNTVELF